MYTYTRLGTGRTGSSRSSVGLPGGFPTLSPAYLYSCTVPHGTSDGDALAKVKTCIFVNGLERFYGMSETSHCIMMTALAEHGNNQLQEWFLLANCILSVIGS